MTIFNVNKDLIEIILPIPIPGYFSYSVPKNIERSKIKIGCRVKVPFGSRIIVGIVYKLSGNYLNKNIVYKEIKTLIDDNPILDANTFALAEWASKYYHHPIGEVISYFMTPSLRRGEKASFASIDNFRITTKGEFASLESLKNSPKQQEALAIFKDLHSLIRVTAKAYNISSSSIKALEEKSLVIKENIENTPEYRSSNEIQEKKELNKEQKIAIDQINSSSGGDILLINGITGSGKTEVYMEAISKIIKSGKQALVLIPEIGLTPQTEDRFKKRFGSKVVSMHSNKNNRERLDAWLSASRGYIDVIIGTRSSVFTPFKDLGIIVVDEEHDLSYKQTEKFRYSGRDIAIYRSKLLNIPIVLASATPSLESIKNTKDKKYSLIELKKRATGAALPKYVPIDIRGQELQNGFSQSLLNEMEYELSKSRQVLIFINRRGYAPAMVCNSCGWIVSCNSCDASMTIHSNPYRMQCHHCDAKHAITKECLSCGKEEFNLFGVGTQKVEEFLEKKFLPYKVLRIDKDTTTKRSSMSNYLKEISSGKPMILVGTQMLAKGHHLSNVTLVGILDADSGLFSADFRGSERVAQLITQVAGRAGREENQGTVLLQTYCPDHPQIEELLTGDYQKFSDRILKERSLAKTPPFSYQARFQAESAKGKLAQDLLQNLKSRVKSKDFRLVGPIPSIMERKAGIFRWELNIYSESRRSLHRELEEMISILYIQKKVSKVRWSLDIDPIGIW